MAFLRAVLFIIGVCFAVVVQCTASAPSGSRTRRILQQMQGHCSHATSALFQCAPMSSDPANTPNFTACVNLCPTSGQPCGFCSEPSVVCAQVYSTNAGRPASFTATMLRFQFGPVCFNAPPPPPGVYAAPPLPFPHFPWQNPPPPMQWPPTQIFPAPTYSAPADAPAATAAIPGQAAPHKLRRSRRALLTEQESKLLRQLLRP